MEGNKNSWECKNKYAPWVDRITKKLLGKCTAIEKHSHKKLHIITAIHFEYHIVLVSHDSYIFVTFNILHEVTLHSIR